MHDLEDLSNRLLRMVSGQLGTAASKGLRQESILIARNLGPAELLEYDKRRLKGVILEEGSLTAHVVIVARAMGIPVLGRVRSLRGLVREGDLLLLDADQGSATVRPAPAMVEAFEARFARSRERQAAYAALRETEPITRCGTRIQVMINAGLREDMPNLSLTGADGIGLFRTEFQFLVSATLPSRERQTRLYREVMDAADPRPVVFRTVDIGGDKALPYLRHDDGATEENPAMGWRALRVALEREGLLKAQARALLEAAAGRTLNVMFPMVAEPWEFDAAKAVFDGQLAILRKNRKVLPEAIRYGAMLEVPALAEMLDQILPKLQFLSIGTNDLTQFLFAADRSNPKLAERYDWLSPAILRFLKRIAEACAAHGVDLGVCGEMGGRPLEAVALLALGRSAQGDDRPARSRRGPGRDVRLAGHAPGQSASRTCALGRRPGRDVRLIGLRLRWHRRPRGAGRRAVSSRRVPHRWPQFEHFPQIFMDMTNCFGLRTISGGSRTSR
jgi:phosphotransferase system enzyme I (PtsP)